MTDGCKWCCRNRLLTLSMSVRYKSLITTLHRSSTKGAVLEMKMVPGMSPSIFIQYDEPVHTSQKVYDRCRDNLPAFWEKHRWAWATHLT